MLYNLPYICITKLRIIPKSTMSKTLNRRILKCITYYRLLDSDDKQIISPLLVEALGKSKSSLYYKFEHKNFSLPELIAIENVIDNFKKTKHEKH